MCTGTGTLHYIVGGAPGPSGEKLHKGSFLGSLDRLGKGGSKKDGCHDRQL